VSRVAPPGLRVLLLTTSYPAAPDDTAGIFVQGFAETLVALGHLVDVVAPALAPSPAQPLSHSANVPHGGRATRTSRRESRASPTRGQRRSSARSTGQAPPRTCAPTRWRGWAR
jgi:hypothetical protein